MSLSWGVSTGFSEQTGGAIFNAGALEAQDTAFSENVAHDDGLAIYNADSDVLVLRDVTFTGNTRSCPSGEYSAIDVSTVKFDIRVSSRTFCTV